MNINDEAEKLSKTLEILYAEPLYPYKEIERKKAILQSFERVSREVHEYGRKSTLSSNPAIAFRDFNDYWQSLTNQD